MGVVFTHLVTNLNVYSQYDCNVIGVGIPSHPVAICNVGFVVISRKLEKHSTE